MAQGRINHSGAHTNVRQGPFSDTRTQDFLSRGALFFSQKVDDLFSRHRRRYVVTFKVAYAARSNIQTST